MNIELKDLSHNPVYAQVREQIESQIKNKSLASGELLPSPAALAQKPVERTEPAFVVWPASTTRQ